MEACKVRIQTQPGWSTTLREGFPRILNEEGIGGFVLLSLVISPKLGHSPKHFE